jgi:hypothetical protein
MWANFAHTGWVRNETETGGSENEPGRELTRRGVLGSRPPDRQVDRSPAWSGANEALRV